MNGGIFGKGGFFQPMEGIEIKNIFAELKAMARRFAPHKLRTIESIEKLAISYHMGRISDKTVLQRLRLMAVSNGAKTDHIDQAEARMNSTPPAMPFPKFDNPMNKKLMESGRMFEDMAKSARKVVQSRPRQLRPAEDPMRMIKKMFGVK